MNIYVGHSRDFEYMKELYVPLMESELNEKHEFIFPHLNEDAFNSKKIIEKADLFIAEVSVSSLGLGIEIGRAEMLNKKILCIYKTKLPSSLKYVNVDSLRYNDKNDMVNRITEYINKKSNF